MNNKIISLESKKYELRLDNFEGPLDLLCYLIDKNKMDIYKVSISDITDQYIQYLKTQEELNLEIASEFLVMASTLLLIKSKGLLPKEDEEEEELTEEELLRRIIEYKKYKEITKVFRERIQVFSKRLYKMPDKIVSDEYVNIEGEKLSKSKGNYIPIRYLLNRYSVDTIRYFLLANDAETKDFNFTWEGRT